MTRAEKQTSGLFFANVRSEEAGDTYSFLIKARTAHAATRKLEKFLRQWDADGMKKDKNGDRDMNFTVHPVVLNGEVTHLW